MKIRISLPFIGLAGLILLVGLACGGGTTTTTTQPPAIQNPPTQPPVQATEPPTQAPTEQPTEPPTEAPTDTPAEAPAYFTEEFDGEIPNWSYFLMKGDETKMDLGTDNGILTFDLNGEDQWVYIMYDPYTYSDIRIDARVENRGFNTNNVSMICRYDKKYGWYEFNVANNGLYWILAYDETIKDYQTLFNGGSTAIHSGKDINEYTTICSGTTLALYINGVEVRTITEKRFAFRDGKAGIGVSSFDVLPIIVEWDYVTFSEP